MKRIAYVCADPGVPVFGSKGCSVHVQEGIRALRNQGASVTLFAQRLGDDPSADLVDVPVLKLPRLSKESAAARETAAMNANVQLGAWLEREGPFDMIYERYSLWAHAGMTFARNAGIPGILEVNAPLIEEQKQHRSLVHENEARQIAERAFASARALIAVSRPVADYLESYRGTTGKVHVIPNGVNPDRFSPEITPAIPPPAGTFTIGFVGTLKPWHGVDGLVEAFAVLRHHAPESRLLIVGDGPQRETIEKQLALHGIRDAAHFTGAVAPEDVPRFIASMDVGVAPYPHLENCYFSPLKIFEYMATGIAVVGSRTGQVTELITHEENGLLYEPGDTAELADLLVRLRTKPELRQQLGLAARKNVLRHHTWNAVGARIFSIAHETQIVEVT